MIVPKSAIELFNLEDRVLYVRYNNGDLHFYLVNNGRVDSTITFAGYGRIKKIVGELIAEVISRLNDQNSTDFKFESTNLFMHIYKNCDESSAEFILTYSNGNSGSVYLYDVTRNMKMNEVYIRIRDTFEKIYKMMLEEEKLNVCSRA